MRKWILVSACLLALSVIALPWVASALPPPGQASAGDAPASVGPQANAVGWTEILTEDFEGAFPGTTWDLEPESPTASDPTWGKESSRKHDGSYSGWCVGDPLSPPGPYPDDTNSWMKYGPFDLSSACDAEMVFWTWYDTEVDDDKLLVGSSLNGSLFVSDPYSGVSGGWKRHRLDLSAKCGSPEVWIAFTFDSDAGLNREGAYVDDIVLRSTTAAPPNAPTLWHPADRECTTDTTPYFDWYVADVATYYRIQVDDSSSFSSPQIDDYTDTPWYEAGSALADDVYYWRVAAVNGCGEGPWSDEWNLWIGLPTSAPNLSRPEDGSHTCDTTPTFDWNSYGMASDWRLQVDTDPGFASPDVDVLTGGYSVHTLTSPLPLGTYFWRVQPINGCADGPWSDVWGFVIHGSPGMPGSPSPADGEVGLSLDTDLDWADATGAMTYTVHFGTSSPPPVYSTTISSELELPTLSKSTDYYWKVIASNNCGDTPGSIWQFLSNRPPHNGTVDPSSGIGTISSNTYFTTTWTDADGWDNLKQCYFHIGDSPSLADNVTLMYNARKNKLWMRTADGTAWSGGVAPGDASSIAHSRASLQCSLTTVHTAGTEVQVTWAIAFNPAYTGAKKTGLKCKDINKAKAKGQWIGTWTIVTPP